MLLVVIVLALPYLVWLIFATMLNATIGPVAPPA